MPTVGDEQLHKVCSSQSWGDRVGTILTWLLFQILQQIQTQLITATRALNMVKAQIQGSENAKRRLELTTKQLDDEVGEVQFWQGVGKM